MTATASLCAISSPRRWKLRPRRVNDSGSRRNATSWTVTTSGTSRTAGTARLGAWITETSSETRGRRSWCHSS